MRRSGTRVEKVERKRKPPELLVHAFPGDTTEQAIAAYERENGPIPPNREVIVIHHSFKSAI